MDFFLDDFKKKIIIKKTCMHILWYLRMHDRMILKICYEDVFTNNQ